MLTVYLALYELCQLQISCEGQVINNSTMTCRYEKSEGGHEYKSRLQFRFNGNYISVVSEGTLKGNYLGREKLIKDDHDNWFGAGDSMQDENQIYRRMLEHWNVPY